MLLIFQFLIVPNSWNNFNLQNYDFFSVSAKLFFQIYNLLVCSLRFELAVSGGTSTGSVTALFLWILSKNSKLFLWILSKNSRLFVWILSKFDKLFVWKLFVL